MAHVLESLQLLATQNYFFAYLIIFLSAIFLGNIAVFAMLWLVIKGFLGPAGLPSFIITVLAAEVSADLLWYSLGRLLRDTRIGNFIKKRIPRHEKIEGHVHDQTGKWIMLGKTLQSSNFPIIFMVGWFKINFKKFVKTAVFANIASITVLMSVSYVIIAGIGGLGPLESKESFGRLERLLIPGLIIFFLLSHFVKKAIEKFDSLRKDA